MAEDVDTNPSFREDELTPESRFCASVFATTQSGESFFGDTDEISRFRQGNVAEPEGTPQRVVDARVGEEVTQHHIQLENLVTQTDGLTLEPTAEPTVTDPDFIGTATPIAKPEPFAKERVVEVRVRITKPKKISPVVLYGVPGMALGMAISAWVFSAKSAPVDNTAGVTVVAQPAPRPVVTPREVINPAEVVTPELIKPTEMTASPKRAAPIARSEPSRRAPAAQAEATLRKIVREAQADLAARDYGAAFYRLHRALPLVDEPTRVRLKTCLNRQTLSWRYLGEHTGRVEQCVPIVKPK